MIDEESVSTGIYDAFLDDPNMCNPFASSMWEMSCLTVPFINQKHYSPVVRHLANQIVGTRDPTNSNAFDFDPKKLERCKNAIEMFDCFPSEGFRVIPGVRIPSMIIAKIGKLKKGTRVDGPTARHSSEFLESIKTKIEIH